MLNKNRLKVIACVLFVSGASLMLFPTLSDKISTIKHLQDIKNYQDTLHLTVENTEDITSLAESYNELVEAKGGYGFTLTEQDLELYNAALNHQGDGMMGYILIPTLSIALPIYHTSSIEVLQTGIGHIESTSLPIGGLSNHSVLTGHSGMSSAKMFSEIDELKIGDQFVLNILYEKLYYEIYNISIVLPHETALLAIQKGEDIVTLVTCTPAGSNTHRLLVQAKRVDFPSDLQI